MLAHSMPSAASLDTAPCSTYVWPSCRMTVELPINSMTGGRAGEGAEGDVRGDGDDDGCAGDE